MINEKETNPIARNLEVTVLFDRDQLAEARTTLNSFLCDDLKLQSPAGSVYVRRLETLFEENRKGQHVLVMRLTPDGDFELVFNIQDNFDEETKTEMLRAIRPKTRHSRSRAA